VLSKCSFLRCWPAREETIDFGEKRSKILTWFNFANPSTGTMAEVEDEEEAEASEPDRMGRSPSTDVAPQIAQLAKNEWLLAAFHDRQELILVISSRARK
jgi:hypothetical protein